MKRILAGLIALALLAIPAEAQFAPPSPAPTSVLSGQVQLSVTSVSARVALPSTAVGALAVTVYNKGTTDAYVALGDVTIVATSGGTCVAGIAGPSCQVPAGASISFWRSTATNIAAITASSTTTLVIYQGSGPLSMLINPTAAGGGSVTSVTGTANQIVVTGTTTPVLSLSSTLVAPGTVSGTALTSTTGSITTQTQFRFVGSTKLDNNATDGTLALFKNDGTSAGTLVFGTTTTSLSSTALLGSTSGARITLNINSGATAPVFIPVATDTTSGIGGISGHIAMIAAGSNAIDCISAGCLVGISGSANNEAFGLTGTLFTGGTGTTNWPLFFIQPTGAAAVTGWSTSGTIFGVNAVSGFGGNFIDLHVAGAGAVFSLDSTGTINSAGNISSGSTKQLNIGSRWGISSPANNVGQLGGVDSATPPAQTLQVANVAAGTTNTAGAAWLQKASASTGNTAGGSWGVQVTSADTAHAVTGFTGAASPYTITFTAGQIATYPIGTVMTVASCTTATLNGSYTVTASSSGSVTATTTATGTGSPTTCTIIGTTSQNAYQIALLVDSTGLVTLNTLPNSQGIHFGSAGSNPYLRANGSNLQIVDSSGTPNQAFNAGTYRSTSTGSYGFAAGADPAAASDTTVCRSGPAGIQIGGATCGTAGTIALTSASLLGSSNTLTRGKATDPGTAPGAGNCKTYWVTGTTGTSGKLIGYCGTSTTPVTIIDNVGSGF